MTQTTTSLLVPPHSVKEFHTKLGPPDVHNLAPVRLPFRFAPWSSISGDFPLCAALGGGQRQETVVSHCGSALFMENACPPSHHVVFLKIGRPLLFLLILVRGPLFILCQTRIQLSGGTRRFGGPGWGVSSGVRGGSTEVISIYLAVRASHKAQTAVTTTNHFLSATVLKSKHEHAEPKKKSLQKINRGWKKTCKSYGKL